MDTVEFLRDLMKRYTTDNVADPVAFEKRIREFLELDDWVMEGYTEDEQHVQRPQSKKFVWGHNHDFGTFKLDGAMGDRHIQIIAKFIDGFGLPRDLTGKNVLDVGVWCGGTSLLLVAMGANLSAIEEVTKYAECGMYLFEEFRLPLTVPGGVVLNKSIYDSEPYDVFDYIIFPGVLYHLTDPILALRILFNALKDGGELYLETAFLEGESGNCVAYHGPTRGGNNWFIPGENALRAMLEDVGFEYSHIFSENGRAFIKGTRKEWRAMMKAGLSRRVR